MQKSSPIIVDAPQRSERWFAARLGNVTASEVERVSHYTKPTKLQIGFAMELHAEQGIDEEYCMEMAENYPIEFCLEVGIELFELQSRKGYREGIVAERITKMAADPDKYISNDMKWGQAQEASARHLYAQTYDMLVEEAPLMLHRLYLCGASPDGFATDKQTGEIGTVEIKCLRSSNHLYKIIRDGVMPQDYYWQVMMQMWITERDWCDFVAYDMRVDQGLDLFAKRVKIDMFFIKNVFEPMLLRFLEEADHDEKVFYAIRKKRLEKMENKAKYAAELRELTEVMS